MAVAMVELCERACVPLLATALLGSLLSGAPQPGPAQPGSVQGQRCPAGHSPGNLGKETQQSRDGAEGGTTATGGSSEKVWAGGQALCLERPVGPDRVRQAPRLALHFLTEATTDRVPVFAPRGEKQSEEWGVTCRKE